MTTHPDEAAFGFSETRYDEHGQAFASLTRRGLTKREYFAALALQGITAGDYVPGDCGDPFRPLTPLELATLAVAHADALIAALNGEGQANG